MARTNFNDSVIWITGASSGIGEALTRALAARGASLALSARREDELNRVRSLCDHAERHFVLPLDMLQPDRFHAACRNVLKRFGRIDLLIHCAGISQRGTALATEPQVDQHVMDVNYFGPIALTKHVLPTMLERGTGQIVVISSLLGKFSLPERAAYSASKHALHGFFDALRAEIETQGVTVTLVCPGFVRTNASFNALEGNGTPHNRMDSAIAHGMSADDCAKKIVRAIERKRREVYVCRSERLGLIVSRYLPGVFHRTTRLQSPSSSARWPE